MDGKPNLDPIEVLKMAIGLTISQQLASVIAPYAVILLASILGAATALGNTPAPVGRWEAIKFFMRGVLTSLLLTVPVATFVSNYSESWQAQWFFIPVAALLSYATGKWKSIIDFFADIAKDWLRRWVDKQPNKDQP